MEKQRNTPLTTEEFIGKATTVHGDRYDYSKVVYKNRQSPVNIICPVHGVFLQRPSSHLAGRGCNICADNVVLTTDGFILRAREVHENKYDYSDVIYINEHTPVLITCPNHGIFQQRPNNHLNGHGCSECGIEMKHLNNGFKWKPYTFPNNRMVEVQGFESQTIDLLLSSSVAPEDIYLNKSEKPIVHYIWQGNSHKYFPDCYVSSSNTIVETKSLWYWNKDIGQNMAKIAGSLSQGYNIRIVVWEKQQLVRDINYYLED